MKLITPGFFVDYFSSKNHVLQDIVVPMHKLEEIIEFSHQEVRVIIRSISLAIMYFSKRKSPFVAFLSKKSNWIKFDNFQVYPLWLCPLKIFNNPTIVHPSGRPDGKYIDIGIYGLTPKVKQYDLEKTTKRFEQFALENDGWVQVLKYQ